MSSTTRSEKKYVVNIEIEIPSFTTTNIASLQMEDFLGEKKLCHPADLDLEGKMIHQGCLKISRKDVCVEYRFNICKCKTKRTVPLSFARITINNVRSVGFILELPDYDE